MRNEFLLSVIIPTKNRQNYAIYAVKQILAMNDVRIQIVIQDNSDDMILNEMLSVYKDDVRIKYNHTKGIISFVDNFSLAVSLADGEYVCIIGDDDGINPQIIDIVEWAIKNNIDAIRPELNAVYFWPYSEAIRNEIDNGYLCINKITGKTKVCNPNSEVIKLLKQGGQNYLSLNLVKLYHGIVRKECLDSIKSQTGKYFGGLSPDIYISVALSLIINKVVVIDIPLTISGICNNSGSADSATGRHTGKLEEAPHFSGHEKYHWSDLVPSFYSVETIWADSAIAAINDLKKDELIKNFSVMHLVTCCLRRYPQYRDNIMESYYRNNEKISKINLITYNLVNLFIIYFKKIIHKLKYMPGSSIRINGVANIIEADKLLRKRLNELGINSINILSSLDKLIF